MRHKRSDSVAGGTNGEPPSADICPQSRGRPPPSTGARDVKRFENEFTKPGLCQSVGPAEDGYLGGSADTPDNYPVDPQCMNSSAGASRVVPSSHQITGLETDSPQHKVAGAIGDPEAVVNQLERVLVGKSEAVRLAFACLLARGHLLIEDVPGVGKTTLARGLGATLGLPWTRVQFTNDLLPADITGVSVFDRDTTSFHFRPGPVFTSILLADEINRAPPKAQSALLEAMEERQVSVDGETHPLPEDFFVVATQNPAEQLGAFPLPESQLDRFLVGLSIGLPDADTERELLEHGDRRGALDTLVPVANPTQLKQWMRDIDSVHVDTKLIHYVQALLASTRETGRFGSGLSPRAGIALMRLCRAWAWLDKRDHVQPEDVQAVFPSVAGHRLTGSVASGQIAARELMSRVDCP